MTLIGVYLAWGFYLFWYLCLILFPNCFHNISDNVLEKQSISPESKLNLVYLNKNTSPKLKCIAIEAILRFIFNIIVTIIYVAVFMYIKSNKGAPDFDYGSHLDVLYGFATVYVILLITLSGGTVFYLSFKK